MRNAHRIKGVLLYGVLLMSANTTLAQDWPQWRGPNRDAKATGFKAPATWPKELTQKWKVTVGNGVATPALVGDKLYVFGREGGDEVTRCLDAATGKELWQDKVAQGFTPSADRTYPGPRSSPTVAEGKVVTLGVNGLLSCLDAATGKVLWRKDDFKGAFPRFHTSSSPIVVDGLCIAQVGGESKGAIVAYELASGNEKWKWAGDGTAYGSPVLANLGGAKVIITPTSRNMVAVGVADGKLLWQVSHQQGKYNAATPVVEGTTLYTGASRGIKAVKLEKKDDGLAEKELWSNPDNSLNFNTPVLKNGLLFGLSNNYNLFCINAADGKTAWAAPLPGGGGEGGKSGGGGFGSVLDAGPVLLAISPAGQLIVFEPSDKEFKQIASYKVADSPTHAYPVVAGNRVYIKDRDSVTLWTLE
jgi:outer membrane protein assembly factor BamB